jgi:hypothetical protein
MGEEFSHALRSVPLREATSLGIRFIAVEKSSVRSGQIWENSCQVSRVAGSPDRVADTYRRRPRNSSRAGVYG